jgi:hypothetical protein
MNANNISYIYIFDISHYIRTKRRDYWGLIVDGEYMGICTSDEIKHFIRNNSALEAVFFHNFQHISLNQIEYIFSGIDTNNFLYVHDYLMLCHEGHFLKEKLKLCVWNESYETRCRDCQYGHQTTLILEQFRNLWKKININFVICPSMTAKERFAFAFQELDSKCYIIPHQKLSGSFLPNGDNRRIAFVGMPSATKGYVTWKKVCGINPKLSYYQFGRKTETIEKVHYFNVKFKKDELNPMVNALRANRIGIVLLWSVWPETYSYTYYESLVTGCFVITNSESGNIAAAVRENGNGIVLENEKDLLELLMDDEQLEALYSSHRRNNPVAPDSLEDNDNILKLFDHMIVPSGSKEIQMKSTFNKLLYRVLYACYRFAYKVLR